MEKRLTYKDAGVDIDGADRFVQQIKTMVKPTFRHEVIGGIGGFGSLFALNPQKYKDPVLVSSTDGVGTKLRIAAMMGKHDTVGIDLVAMCVNDVVVMGAEPLFMRDYISIGKIDKKILTDLVSGMVAGCKEADCALIGGETAEMPSFYKPGDYDIAGFVVGSSIPRPTSTRSASAPSCGCPTSRWSSGTGSSTAPRSNAATGSSASPQAASTATDFRWRAK